MISQIDGEKPRMDGESLVFGSTQPHSDVLSTPSTIIASPAAERTAPMRSRCGRCAGGASWMRRAKRRIRAATMTSPAKTQRHDEYVVASPPISGPTATAMAAAAAIRP